MTVIKLQWGRMVVYMSLFASKVYWLARIGQNFDDYPGFQPKITHPKHLVQSVQDDNYEIVINLICAVYLILLHTPSFLLEIRVMIKISNNPCYPINVD